MIWYAQLRLCCCSVYLSAQCISSPRLQSIPSQFLSSFLFLQHPMYMIENNSLAILTSPVQPKQWRTGGMVGSHSWILSHEKFCRPHLLFLKFLFYASPIFIFQYSSIGQLDIHQSSWRPFSMNPFLVISVNPRLPFIIRNSGCIRALLRTIEGRHSTLICA